MYYFSLVDRCVQVGCCSLQYPPARQVRYELPSRVYPVEQVYVAMWPIPKPVRDTAPFEGENSLGHSVVVSWTVRAN